MWGFTVVSHFLYEVKSLYCVAFLCGITFVLFRVDVQRFSWFWFCFPWNSCQCQGYFFFVFPIPFRMFYSYTLGQKMAPVSFHPFAPWTVTKCKAVLHCREKNAQNFILRFPHVQSEHTVDDLYIPVSWRTQTFVFPLEKPFKSQLNYETVIYF